jgi:hypothetical protein
MAWRIVRQPNGLLARFSDVVDNFTDMNMSEVEAYELCRESMGIEDAREKVRAGVEDWKPWTHRVKGDGLSRWADCLNSIKVIHGEREVENVKNLVSPPLELPN